MNATTRTELLRSAWGTVLLSQPTRVVALLGPDRTPRFAVFVARVLGARQLAQAAVTARARTPGLIRLGAAADALHACTGVAVAVLIPRWRRTALADAAIAAGFGVAGQLRARRAWPR